MLAFVAGAAMDVVKFDPTVISFANLLVWQFPWVVGILATVPVSAGLATLLGDRLLAVLALGLVALGFALVEIMAGKAMTPYLILAAPLVVFGLVRLFGQIYSRLTSVLAWFGRLTLGLWLVHPFFCYYFAQEWIYAPLYSPLVFAALVIASLAVVLPVEGLRTLLGKAVRPSGAEATAR